MFYIRKFNYRNLNHGERKRAETRNGRQLLAESIKREYGIDFDSLSMAQNEYGKPYFSDRCDIHFNISHSGDYAAVVLSDSEVGIDVQIVKDVHSRLPEKLCNDEELKFIESAKDKRKAFITLWALKESYVKAVGLGMHFPMNEINFSLDGYHGEKHGEFSNREGMYYVRDYGDYVVAVCYL